MKVRKPAVIAEAGLALIPGPEEIPEPYFSTEVHDLVEYDCDEVARVFDGVAKPMGTREGDPDTWRWRWQSGEHFVEIGFSLLGEGRAWGGSNLELHVPATLLLQLWNRVRRELPAVWLHDSSCRMYRPESFVTEFSVGGRRERR